MADMFYFTKSNSHQMAGNMQRRDGPPFVPLAPLVSCAPPPRQRRSRTMFTEAHIQRLEEFFVRDPYPDIYSREQLAEDIGVPEARIQTWFQNKRSRTRRQINNQRRTSPTPVTPPSSGPSSPSTPASPRQPPPPGRATSPYLLQGTSRAPAVTPGAASHHCHTQASRKQETTSPKTPVTSPRADQNDSGVLDLSIKSNESPKETPASSAAPQMAPHPDAGRPFFTPWATPTPSASSFAARRAAADAIFVAATRAHQAALPVAPVPASSSGSLPRATPGVAHNPWMYGFTPGYNAKDGVYYLQPLPNSPLLQRVADTALPASPGLSPLAVGGAPWSPTFLSPSLRTSLSSSVFVFPDVQSTMATATASSGVASCRGTTTDDDDSSEHPVSEGSTSPASVALPPSADKSEDLSGSPGSDTGSGSSGYSSRDCLSPIDVCN